MPDKATDATGVISAALATDTATADDILNALGHAGYRVIRPEHGPAWMPVTARSLAKVHTCAALLNDGKTPPQIATVMRVSPRQVERYGAAARALGLTERRH